MLIVNEKIGATRLPALVLMRVEQQPTGTLVCLGGRLTAYLPQAGRPHYRWALAISYSPGRQVSIYELRPPLLRASLLSRWELGLLLGHWRLGLKLKQPLIWLKRLRAA